MFSFNGTDFSEFEYVFVQSVGRPILPPLTIQSTDVPNRHGEIFHRLDVEPVTIPIEIVLHGEGYTAFRNNVREFASYIYSNSLAELIFNDEPDKYIMAILSEESELEEIVNHGSGTIEFYCPDPYFYAIDDDEYSFDVDGGLDESFTRQGTAESFPVIEIEGMIDDGSISITVNDTTIEYDDTLSEVETLVIDSELITAYREGDGERESAIDGLSHLDLPTTFAGTNMIELQQTGDASINVMRIKCRSRWH